MHFLFLSILCATIIYVIFRWVNVFKANTLHVVIFNYSACVILGLLLLEGEIADLLTAPAGLYILSFILGTSFMVVFYHMARTTQLFGIAVSSIVSRMSLIIPASFAILYYNEPISLLKISGIILGLAAIYLSLYKEKKDRLEMALTSGQSNFKLYLIPVIAFGGSGFVDTLLKVGEVNYLHTYPQTLFLTLVFSSAMIAAYLLLIYDITVHKTVVKFKSIKWGALLGLFNFFAVYFFLLSFEFSKGHASVIFPLNHIGIVVCSTLIAAFFYGEKLSMKNITGIFLSIVSILMILYTNE